MLERVPLAGLTVIADKGFAGVNLAGASAPMATNSGSTI
jgi:hypothetical protein